MRESITHQTEGMEAVIGSNDQNLVYFEMGTNKQPPRSVLGAAAFETMPEVLKIVGHATVTGIVGGDSKSETY